MKFIRRIYHAMHRNRNAQFQALMRNMSLSSDELQALHDEYLRDILRYAVKHVPHYKPLAAEFERVAPLLPAKELLMIFPVVTREELRNNPEQHESDERQSIPCYHNGTGGSTGEPLRFWSDYAYKSLGQAALMRSFAMMGCAPDEEVLWFWLGSFKGAFKESLQAIFRPICSGKRLIDVRHIGENDFPAIADLVNRRKIRFIYGYVSAICFLAQWMLRNNRAMPSVQGIMTTAEFLSPEQRQVIEKAFGTRAYNQYGSREVTGIATECSRGGMHLFPDMMHIEVEEEAGKSRGPLLLTSLHNRSMPLIRYRNGDEGGLLAGKCDCGLSLPLMRLDVGRVLDYFVLPSGRNVHTTFFIAHLMHAPGIAQFQFAQTARNEIEARIVKAPGFGSATQSYLDKLPQLICSTLGEHLEVNVKIMDAIPLTRSGKFRFAVCQIPNPD